MTSLQDALLSNADRLLQAAVTMLDVDELALARSLAILGMEESGKAIALHKRRVLMAYAPEGEAFVDRQLRDLWGKHHLKLDTVHQFLVDEEYWFGVEASDPVENERLLGTIEAWTRTHNADKQRGFYVDVSGAGDPIMPTSDVDAETVREVVGYVHQIGWQLRLGEHIEGKQRLESERDIPPASEDEIADMKASLKSVDSRHTERIIASMRRGTQGTKLNNAEYAFTLPDNPFDTVGRPGYEAQDRELRALIERLDHEEQQSSEAPENRANSVNED
ncbi:AbiV family abortive infection protein [Microbacterium sp. BF1]|uniref:AbiV family abortive infection protein n=1 Tax=Microbacterium sp. BF1 TaxID=2821146 RepID=UPI001C4DFF89|nr:AbiV family abortive infection protein [Microbacterium sp. BF1]